MNFIINLFAGIGSATPGAPINVAQTTLTTLMASDNFGIAPNVAGLTPDPTLLTVVNATTGVRAQVQGSWPAPAAQADLLNPLGGTYQQWVNGALGQRITEARMENNDFIMEIDFNGAGPTLREFYSEWEVSDILSNTATINGREVDSNGTPLPEPVDPVSLTGDDGPNNLTGDAGNDTLRGGAGDDTLNGADGADTLDGGDGDDFIFGGSTEADLRDVIFGGTGNDSIDGGYGNDSISGGDDNDTIAGGFGADTVIGNSGDDVLTGSGFSDLMFGNDGNDFINGGFGFDRVNGGAGADRFFHIGISDHGSDWIQDYSAAENDVLVWAGVQAGADDFLVQRASTASAGAANVQEVFITHIPSQLLVWALVDGDAQDALTIQTANGSFDLLMT